MGNIKRRRKTKKLSLLEDYDQDGVHNFDDCRPLDPTQHGVWDWTKKYVVPIYKKYVPPPVKKVVTPIYRKYVPPVKRYVKPVKKYIEPVYREVRERVKPIEKIVIPHLERRIITPTIGIGRDIGRDIKANIARVGIDIPREARAPKRPLEERMLFGGFVERGERVGRLAVAPTPPRVGLERMEVTPVREAKRVEFAPTIPFVSDIPTRLTAMYREIKPPPEVQAVEGRIGELEVGVSAFEAKWEPYVRGEQFIGTEVQHQRMLKEHAALERRVTPVEEAQRGLMEPQYLKAERKLKGYKTGWIYAGTELALEWYGRKVLQAQEDVATIRREREHKAIEHPWLKELEHAQWYTAKELPGMVLRGGAMIPPAIEAMFKEPEKMQAAVLPGLAFMGKGMVEEARREPLGFAETMGISMLAPKAAMKVSPIKYMEMKVPTGKSLIKTWTTIGKGVPSEFKMLKEAAGPFGAVELGKTEPTWMPGIYKQTHLIPEMVTYRGLRASLPSAIPYKGKAPLVGVVTRPPGIGIKRMQVALRAPEFELPAQFRVFTAPEAALVMPSMRKMLKGGELAEWKAAIYLQESFGRKRPIVRDPVIMANLERLNELFKGTEGLQEFTRYMQKHRRSMLIYGSGAKRSQLARPELITPKDIDIEIRTIASRLTALTTETKVPFRARLMPFEVELAHRVSRRIPGLTPEKVAADMAAMSKKYLGGEDIQVSFKPAWQMFSVEKVLKTMQKTTFGLEPEVAAIADIHPPSGLFEFGLKSQRPVLVPIISGLPGEKLPFFPKRIRITTLGEEFQHSFGSVIQMYERRGKVTLGPKPKRIKDIGRFIIEGKTLVETERLRAELGLSIFKPRRMRKVEKGREALAIWERKALKESGLQTPEMAPLRAALQAEAILPGMESVLKQQMRAQSLMLSERAVLGPGYKPRLREVDYPKVEVGRMLDTTAYYPTKRVPSDYYPPRALPYAAYDYYPKPVPAYGDSDYYGMPMYKHVAKRGVPTPFIGVIPTAFVPFGVPTVSIMPTFKPTPTPKMITGAPMPTTTFVPPPTGFFVPPPGAWVPPPTGWTPPPPPPTTVWTPPPPPPTTIWTPPPPPPPPPTTIWVPPPPPPPTYMFPILPSEEKPRRRKKKYKFEEIPWKEKHYIPTLRELMRPIPGMKVSKPMDFEPKMPSFPKGIM